MSSWTKGPIINRNRFIWRKAGLQCITVQCQKGDNETFLHELLKIAAAKVIPQPTRSDEGLPETLKHNRCIDVVCRSDDNSCCQILQHIHGRPKNKLLQMTQREKCTGVRSRGRPSNRSATFRDMQQRGSYAQQSQNVTIMHEPHVLSHSGMYSLHQIREDFL